MGPSQYELSSSLKLWGLDTALEGLASYGNLLQAEFALSFYVDVRNAKIAEMTRKIRDSIKSEINKANKAISDAQKKVDDARRACQDKLNADCDKCKADCDKAKKGCDDAAKAAEEAAKKVVSVINPTKWGRRKRRGIAGRRERLRRRDMVDDVDDDGATSEFSRRRRFVCDVVKGGCGIGSAACKGACKGANGVTGAMCDSLKAAELTLEGVKRVNGWAAKLASMALGDLLVLELLSFGAGLKLQGAKLGAKLNARFKGKAFKKGIDWRIEFDFENVLSNVASLAERALKLAKDGIIG